MYFLTIRVELVPPKPNEFERKQSNSVSTLRTNSYMILFIIAAYFAVLLLIAWITGRNNSNEAFFLGNRKSC